MGRADVRVICTVDRFWTKESLGWTVLLPASLHMWLEEARLPPMCLPPPPSNAGARWISLTGVLPRKTHFCHCQLVCRCEAYAGEVTKGKEAFFSGTIDLHDKSGLGLFCDTSLHVLVTRLTSPIVLCACCTLSRDDFRLSCAHRAAVV